MCMSLPGEVARRGPDGTAEVRLEGAVQWCNALAEPGVRVGDWVLVQTGLIVARFSAEEAAATLADLREMAALMDEDSPLPPPAPPVRREGEAPR